MVEQEILRQLRDLKSMVKRLVMEKKIIEAVERVGYYITYQKYMISEGYLITELSLTVWVRTY
jgi:NACalpha-BTF3-like transcription factor